MSYFSLPRSGLVLELMGNGGFADTNDGTKETVTPTNLSYGDCPAGYQKQWGVFNGSSAYVTTNYGGNDSSYTLSGFFQCDVSNTSNKTLVYKGVSGSTRAFWGLVARNNHPTFARKLVFLFDGDVSVYSTTNFDDGLPHRFRLTATSGDVKLYVDGVLEASSVSITNVNDTGTLQLGREAAGTDYWNGKIGAFRYHNRILTDEEDRQLSHEYHRKLGGGGDFGSFVPAPSAHYDLLGDGCDVATGSFNTSTSVTYGQADHLGLNRAAQFNGSAYIDLTYASNPITSGAYSVYSVFKTPASAPANIGVIYAHSNSSNNAQLNFGLRNSSGMKLEIGIWNGSTIPVIQSAALSTSTWYAAVAVCNGASSALYVAQIGGSVATSSGTLNTVTPGFDRCCIGRDRYGNAYYFTGYVSCVGTIDKALTADQAKFLLAEISGDTPYAFRRSIPLALQSKFHAWLPGYISGTTVYDLSGNGNNGTAAGSPATARAGQGPCITFDGVNDTVTFPNIANIYGVTVFAKPTAASKTLATLAAGKTISLGASYELTSSGLTSPVYWRDDAVATAGSGSKWGMYTVGFSAETSSSGSWGTSSLTGNSGDFILWKEPPTSQAVQMLHKALYRN